MARLNKTASIALAILLSVVLILILFGKSFALRIANHYLQPYNIDINCAQWSLNNAFNPTFDKLCITHPLVNAQIKGLKVRWSLLPKFAVSDVQIENIVVHSASELKQPKKSDNEPFTPAVFHQLMTDIAGLTLPTTIDVNQFNYQPFGEKNTYPGSLTADGNGIILSISTPNNDLIFSGQLTTTGETLSGVVNSDFVQVRRFLTVHDIPLPNPINELLEINGRLSTSFAWKNNRFNAKNQLQNLNITSDKGLNGSGPFAINTNQSWHTTLNQNVFSVEFDKPQPINISMNDKAIIDLLTQKQLPEQLLTFVKDNPTKGITLLPQGRFVLDFGNKYISLSALKIQNQNKVFPLSVELNNSHIPFDQSTITSEFKASIKVKLSALSAVTRLPVILQTSGILNKTQASLNLTFDQGSQIAFSKLAWDKQVKASAAWAKMNWQGEITLDKNQQPTFDLKLQSQLHQLLVKKWTKVTLIKTDINLKGPLNAISINGDIVTDDIALAQFKIDGDIKKPSFEVAAKDIALIDLLALNLSQMAEIELIDGAVDYNLSGQILKFDALDQNPLKLSLNVHDLSGTVEKTWIQDLNWQQNFTLKNGKLTTDAKQNNFSLAFVESGTELTELAATTNISRIQQTFSLTVDNVKGNAFDGQFAIPTLEWPTNPDKPVLLQLTAVDLEKIVALEKQKGIVVTGRISGELPLYFAGTDITISDGKLYNVTDGLIQIKDNPAVQRLKQTQDTLKIAFGALENLHYNQLTSEVSMSKDGQMYMETQIKGINPDLENEVNFNLNLDYDLLGLLQSARIAEVVEQQINDKIEQ
jgi:hypothetical protein